MYLVISSSLNPNSRSRVLARETLTRLQAKAGRLEPEPAPVQFYDLQEVQLPLCDGGACYADPEVQRLAGLVQAAHGIVLATPVYNYDVSATAKNIVELTGRAWTEKTAAFVCAAGGGVSYMSAMGLANSLMLDFRSLIIPRFVFATGQAFDERNRLIDEQIAQRIDQLVDRLVEVTQALPPPAA